MPPDLFLRPRPEASAQRGRRAGSREASSALRFDDTY
jgi:hypothetical protein